MYYSNGDFLEIQERKFTLESLYMMYREHRILFPDAGSLFAYNRGKELNNIINAAQMGIPMLAVYALELQNGALLLIENAGSRLQSLLNFLNDKGSFDYFYEGHHIDNCRNQDLMNYFPMLYNRLMDTGITLNIVDYDTPAYMQMQIAKMICDLSPTKEQNIRELLYDDFEIYALIEMTNRIEVRLHNRYYRSNPYFERYKFLYMSMIWLIFKDELHDEEIFMEQHMIDWTLYQIYKENAQLREFERFVIEKYVDLMGWRRSIIRGSFWRSRNVESPKLYGYLLCAMYIGCEREMEETESLNRISQSGFLQKLSKQINNIQMDRDTIRNNIQELKQIVR